MADIRRYAFLYEGPDGERNEYTTGGEGLSAETAVERAYGALPDGATLVKTLRGSVSDDVSLSPPSGVTANEDEGARNPNIAETGNLDLPADESDAEEAPAADDGDEWDEAQWLDLGYKERETRVLGGEVDDHLDAIEDAETSKTVEQAVEERRETLEVPA